MVFVWQETFVSGTKRTVIGKITEGIYACRRSIARGPDFLFSVVFIGFTALSLFNSTYKTPTQLSLSPSPFSFLCNSTLH
jgi:hypothetical protein